MKSLKLKLIVNLTLLLELILSPSVHACEAPQSKNENDITKWVYAVMKAWDDEKKCPSTNGLTGKDVSIAVIEGPNFALDHPALKNSNITLIDFGKDNLLIRDEKRGNQYHANHVTGIIAGKVCNTFVHSLDLSDITELKLNNPNILSGQHFNNSSAKYHLRSSYYGGLAPDSKVYAYPRKLEDENQDMGIILSIFQDIGKKDDIRLINLSFKLCVNPQIIEQLNELAEKGKIFIQAAGNDGYNLSLPEHSDHRFIQCYDGASLNNFSSTFWEQYICVGALSCYGESSEAKMEKWKKSSYYSSWKKDPYIKNFIMAPGVCILAPDQEGYVIKSGTSMAAPFVTGALACALEQRFQQQPQAVWGPETLITHLVSCEQKIHLTNAEELKLPVLNVKKLIELQTKCAFDNVKEYAGSFEFGSHLHKVIRKDKDGEDIKFEMRKSGEIWAQDMTARTLAKAYIGSCLKFSGAPKEWANNDCLIEEARKLIFSWYWVDQ